ncbi:MAG: iron ABC transporter permease [Alphaproteobacteria bacterium]|nr:iron ABC transporter permease [Alphaproteobacteria bacterium]
MAAPAPPAPARDAGLRLRRGEGGTLPFALLLLLVGFLALYPIGWLVAGSFSTGSPLEAGRLTLANYATAYGDPEMVKTLRSTIVFALGQMAVAVALGTALAWVVARTAVPGRRIFEFLITIVFLMPLILGVIAWTMLLSPGKGILNQALMALFGLERPPINIYSMGGMIFVQGLYVTPLAFLVIVPGFRAMNATLEEAARIAGAGAWGTFRRITLPMMAPSILSAALLLTIIGIESFDVPQLLGQPVGIFTYPTLIYGAVASRYPPDYGTGTALAVSLLGVTMIGVLLYRRATRMAERFATLSGKGGSVAPIDLGRWRWVVSGACWAFFALAVFLPLAVLLLGSFLRFFGRFDAETFTRLTFDNYARALSHPRVVEGAINSLLVSSAAALICVALALAVGYFAMRTARRGRGLLETLAMLPISFPATVLGLGLLWGYVVFPLPIYGTVAILLIAFATRYLPIGLRTLAGPLLQLSRELEEAAWISGAGRMRAVVAIVVPLLRPALLSAWVLLFMMFMRELGMSILLAGLNNPVLSVVMYDYYESGELPLLSALCLMLMLGVGLVALAVQAILSRRRFTIGVG